MTPKTITILAIAALVAVLAAALAIRGQGTPAPSPAADTRRGEAVFAGLATQVTEVATIEIETPTDTFALRMQDGIWRVPDPDGYWADQDRVASLLGGLAMLEIREQKTSNPDLYDRLGVEDVGPGASSARVTLRDGGGGELADLLVGRTATAGGSERRSYVRRPADGTALLVSGTVALPRSPAQWIDSLLVDIDPGRIERLEIDPWNGDPFAVVREGENEVGQPRWAIDPLPAGKEVANPRDLQNAARGFQGFRQSSVRPLADAPDGLTSATLARATTRDGVVVEATFRHNPANDTYWATFSAAFDEQLRLEGEEVLPAGEARAQADSLARKVDGWIIQAPAWKATAFYKTAADLLRDAPAPPPPPIVAEPEPAEPAGP